MRRFSEMTALELEAEAAKLLQERETAMKAGMQSHAELLERKYEMAMSYTLSPELYKPGLYHVKGSGSLFQLEYLNGVMAWGTMDGAEASLPISTLTKKE